ncbi:MAG: DNA topoisomerase IB [Candidatus Cyclobacteriaceae bacterium M3_2C_046]
MNEKELQEILEDPQEVARFAGLVYVTDKMPGITRKKWGKGFIYYDEQGHKIEPRQVERYKKLVIPPAWQDVWICPLPEGHLQATGYDKKKRKQYKYHLHWVKIRNETKYYRLLSFAKSLVPIRKQVEKDLNRSKFDARKVLAVVVSLMEHSAIRIGNEVYKKLYGSFGLTTLRNKHVQVKGKQIYLQFRGKKGVYQNVSIKSKKLAKQVKRCKEIPGYELFQFYDELGKKHKIDSGMVNQYIYDVSGHEFTSKDFRTWSGTVYAFEALRELGDFHTQKEKNKKQIKAIDMVAKRLGNSRSISKKYYIHPGIFHAYETKTLFPKIDEFRSNSDSGYLSIDEKMVMHILSDYDLSDVLEKE